MGSEISHSISPLFVASTSQENIEAAKDISYRLPGSLLTILSATRYGLPIGIGLGIALESSIQLGWAIHDKKIIDQKLLWEILSGSTKDISRTAISLLIGGNLRKWIPHQAITRNVLANVSVGLANNVFDIVTEGQTDLRATDLLIWGVSGVVGGLAQPRLKHVATEAVFEYFREIGESGTEIYTRHKQISSADAIRTTAMAAQELGTSGWHSVASRRGPGTGSTLPFVAGALALAFDVSNYALHSNDQSTNNQQPPVSSAAVLSGIRLLCRKRPQISPRQIPAEGFVTDQAVKAREMELLRTYSIAQETGDVAQCFRALENLKTFYSHLVHLLRFNGKAGLAWVTDTEQALVELIKTQGLFSEFINISEEGECFFGFPTHLGVPLALRVEGEQLPDIIHLPGQREELSMSSIAYFRIDALGKIQNVVSDQKVNAVKAKLRKGLLYVPNTPVVDSDIFPPIHVFLHSVDGSCYIHDGYNRAYGVAEAGYNYILGRLMGRASRGERPLYDLTDIRVVPHDEYMTMAVRQARDNVIPSYNDPTLYDPPPSAVGVGGRVLEEVHSLGIARRELTDRFLRVTQNPHLILAEMARIVESETNPEWRNECRLGLTITRDALRSAHLHGYMLKLLIFANGDIEFTFELLHLLGITDLDHDISIEILNRIIHEERTPRTRLLFVMNELIAGGDRRQRILEEYLPGEQAIEDHKQSPSVPVHDSLAEMRARFRELFAFRFNGETYYTVADLVGPYPPYEAIQTDIHTNRLITYATEILEGRWDWNNMRARNVNGDIIDDPIVFSITPSGRILFGNGHHRYLAALLTGEEIPANVIQYEQLDYEPEATPWKNVDWMIVDPHNVYPVLRPPTGYTPQKR